jgi:hypothetical protein
MSRLYRVPPKSPGEAACAFRRDVRPQVIRLLRQHAGSAEDTRALMELADVAPVIVFVLARQECTVGDHVRALDLQKQGRRLTEVFSALGLPYWLRLLPAWTFSAPLGELPCNRAFGARNQNLLPHEDKNPKAWLEAICLAVRFGGQSFAVWLAKALRSRRMTLSGDCVIMLAAYAWYSTAPQYDAARLILRPWLERMGFETAAAQAALFFSWIIFATRTGPGGLQDGWARPGHSRGIDFTLLGTAEAVLDEARAMDNCLYDYSGRLLAGEVRLFGLRRGGQPIGTLELVRSGLAPDLISFRQVLGYRNGRLPPRVMAAAHHWLADELSRLEEAPLAPARNVWADRARYDTTHWRHLWNPFLMAQGVSDLIPDAVTPPVIAQLTLRIDALRCAGTGSSMPLRLGAAAHDRL